MVRIPRVSALTLVATALLLSCATAPLPSTSITASPTRAAATIPQATATIEAGTVSAKTPTTTVTAAKPSGTSIPFAIVAQSAPLGDRPSRPLYTIVASDGQWNDLRGNLPPIAIEEGSRSTRSGDSLVVVAFGGSKGSGGYSINVESVVQQGAQVTVVVAQATPRPEDKVEPATTLPYCLASIPRTSLLPSPTITFIFRDAQGNVLNQVDIPFS